MNGMILPQASGALLAQALSRMRQGEPAAARALAERALALSEGHPAAASTLGTICAAAGDLAAAATHLGAAHARDPANGTTAFNLATILGQAERFEEALTVATAAAAAADPGGRFWRLRGWLLSQTGASAAAAAAYERSVEHAPDDHETWNNLGGARIAAGAAKASGEAYERAAHLRPDLLPIRLNWAVALQAAGDRERCQQVLNACVRDFPNEPEPWRRLGYLLAGTLREADAIAAFERAIALGDSDVGTLVALGGEQLRAGDLDGAAMVLDRAIARDQALADAHFHRFLVAERANRIDDLARLIEQAERAAIDSGAIAFMRAIALQRQGRFTDAIGMIADAAPACEPVRRHQLLGECRDRIGDSAGAFADFAQMNRLIRDGPGAIAANADVYRERVRRDRAVVSPAWAAGWRPAPRPSRPAPVFLVGFPRSGTTLLDTFLLGHDRVRVIEERPPLDIVEHEAGGIANLPNLDETRIAALRDRYWAEVAREIAVGDGDVLVDKYPMHLTKLPIAMRLFPDARFVLSLRHPCDVVLSCFATPFRANAAMSNFLDLRTAAETYDLVFDYWRSACEILGPSVIEIRYEDLVDDPAFVLPPLFANLGLDWQATALNHRRTANARSAIETASYAQVTEPVYRRSAGRWRRYRAELEPILPVLEPWIDRFGYAV